MLTIDQNKMRIEHYKKVKLITSDNIQIQLQNHVLIIFGNHLHVLALEKEEILLEGKFEMIEFHDEI